SRCLDFAGTSSAKLQPTDRVRLFQILNAVNWSMTAVAISCRRPWRAKCRDILACRGQDVVPAGILKRFGGQTGQAEDCPAAWMPTAYLAFRASDRESIFAWC